MYIWYFGLYDTNISFIRRDAPAGRLYKTVKIIVVDFTSPPISLWGVVRPFLFVQNIRTAGYTSPPCSQPFQADDWPPN
jgi:hypothetical protein